MIVGLIPARYASTRFPGKPLERLGGMSILERCYRQCLKAELLQQVWIATDDERIAGHARSFGADVILTDPAHLSGTDRIAEAVRSLEQTSIVINIQGDEPFIHPQQIDQLVSALLQHPDSDIATLAMPIRESRNIQDPNVVKVVLDVQGRALYFSRSAIPFDRGGQLLERPEAYLQHIGLYGYRAGVLAQIAALPPGALEQIESLEQLRWLENGYRIQVSLTDRQTMGIDTPEDLERAERWLLEQR